MDQANHPKLLLADDSVTIRKVAELTFADEGIDVTTVGDSATAMSRFVEIQPDIVLVDIGLDGTSGYQICEMIKADDATRHIPVLLLVGSFEPFDQDEAERVGADGFLTKPFNSIRDLVARVWELLGRDAAAPQAVPAQVDAFSGGHGSLDHLETDLPAVPASTEDDDIDELYRSSFAETVEIDEYDTVDDMLGDPALDDEMIEASYPGSDSSEGLTGLVGEKVEAEAAQSSAVSNFDWSPAAVVSESAVSAEPAFEPKFVFDESEAEKVEAPNDNAGFERVVDDEDVGLDALIGRTAEPADDRTTDESAVNAVDAADGAPVDEPASDPSEPEIWPEVEPSSGQMADAATGVLTPEVLDMIADKVVSRLSDQVIREIALDAVPRIAEKLIREALSETGKSNDNKGAKETAA